MKKNIAIFYLIFIVTFSFGIDLNDFNFYRSLEKEELMFFINLLKREQLTLANNCALEYIELAYKALKEKNINLLLKNNKELPADSDEHLRQSKVYNNARLIFNATKDLNTLVHISKDGFLKTLDGRNVGVKDNKFIILDSFLNNDFYDDVSSEYTTIEIYNKSILMPNLNKFLLDKRSNPFVYLEDFNKNVYLNDIPKLSKEELLFLFYELFPVSKLKSLKDWNDFGFSSILKVLNKIYSEKINSRRGIVNELSKN
ncbi:hypothetical protein [Borreliella afzelii]|uniref:Uncharacterized protein n=2 Tax=Borreliella afzelii TaxID=29518 RepID=Q0SMX5_BORAP|nr:hypothetical protein [Borreliella afzelii]ABH01803.1 hypothetical protein BAPKO_0560 [Borreliella afzelii PKo]AJY72512.1 hypothetical protein BAFK78_532 [Borreliella afzelii K78]EEC21132.1 conserved hypothetical protein [Borreliella afzelii ACA-1]AEL69755.1 putative uncharacterized protein [Borreliella afzelii PKo]MBB5140920.1 hypothetical protein [Borreliella afzelii]